MPIKFLYFDLGRVLLDFTHQRGFEQIAEVANVSAERVKEILVDEGLGDQYELGALSTTEFHRAFCEATGVSIPCEVLAQAWGDIFDLIPGTVRLAASLRSAGYPIGILSNTCAAHWEHAVERFRILGELFHPVITSYDAKSMKPDAAIYELAARRSRIEPANLFFVDDREENVQAAQQLGWTAVQFEDPLKLANDLGRLGVVFNR